MARTALKLGPRTFGPDELVIMAIVNRTPDSFYDKGAAFSDDAARAAAHRAVDEGLFENEGGASRHQALMARIGSCRKQEVR